MGEFDTDYKLYYRPLVDFGSGVGINESMEKYNLEEGKELGQKLKKIKDFWIENGFKLTNKDVEKIMNT